MACNDLACENRWRGSYVPLPPSILILWLPAPHPLASLPLDCSCAMVIDDNNQFVGGIHTIQYILYICTCVYPVYWVLLTFQMLPYPNSAWMLLHFSNIPKATKKQIRWKQSAMYYTMGKSVLYDQPTHVGRESVDCRPLVDHSSADCWSLVGCLLAISWSTVAR